MLSIERNGVGGRERHVKRPMIGIRIIVICRVSHGDLHVIVMSPDVLINVVKFCFVFYMTHRAKD